MNQTRTDLTADGVQLLLYVGTGVRSPWNGRPGFQVMMVGNIATITTENYTDANRASVDIARAYLTLHDAGLVVHRDRQTIKTWRAGQT